MACAKINSLSSNWIANNPFSSHRGSSSLPASRRVSLPIRATSYSDELVQTAKSVASRGRGILAIDESNATCGKRLASIGLDNTEVNRQAYRQLLLTTPGLGEYISGAILFEETLYQSTTDGKKFVDVLREEKIVPGIKVDKGLVPLPGSNNESWCQGLDGLASRSAEYYKQGARFAKWRTVVSIPCGPSALAVKEAAWGLARYAAISQMHSQPSNISGSGVGRSNPNNSATHLTDQFTSGRGSTDTNYPLWAYVTILQNRSQGKGNVTWRCNYCNQTYKSSYFRVKCHLLRDGPDMEAVIFTDVGARTNDVVDTNRV